MQNDAGRTPACAARRVPPVRSDVGQPLAWKNGMNDGRTGGVVTNRSTFDGLDKTSCTKAGLFNSLYPSCSSKQDQGWHRDPHLRVPSASAGPGELRKNLNGTLRRLQFPTRHPQHSESAFHSVSTTPVLDVSALAMQPPLTCDAPQNPSQLSLYSSQHSAY